MPFHARPSAQPAGERSERACAGARLPGRTPAIDRELKYPCDILLRGLVFENQRQRVGCVRLLTLKGVLSIAVEFERALLTANKLRNPILSVFTDNGKPCFLSGGIS